VKRLFDLLIATLALTLLALPLCTIALAIKLSSRGPVLYWSDRVGKDNRIFKMPKFRSMRTDTPAVATHLLSDPDQYLIPIGSFLRKTSLDELPQLWSILVGDMSLVGPRPALFNQEDLIALRTERGVHALVPGLTGWAQINGRNAITWQDKFKYDVWYVDHWSFWLDLKIIFLTAWKVIQREGISQEGQATTEYFKGEQ